MLGRPGHRLMVILAAPGCAFAAATGGCSNCGFPKSFGTGHPVSAEDLQAQLRAALDSIPPDDSGPVEVDLYCSGSYLNADEIPVEAQAATARRGRRAAPCGRAARRDPPRVRHGRGPGARRRRGVAARRSRSRSASRAPTPRSSPGGSARASAGTTSPRPPSASPPPARASPSTCSSSPSTPARERPSRTASPRRGACSHSAPRLGVATRVALEPCFVAPGTPLDEAFRAGRYRPPWLWSVVEVVTRVAPLGRVLVGLSEEGLEPARGAAQLRLLHGRGARGPGPLQPHRRPGAAGGSRLPLSGALARRAPGYLTRGAASAVTSAPRTAGAGGPGR